MRDGVADWALVATRLLKWCATRDSLPQSEKHSFLNVNTLQPLRRRRIDSLVYLAYGLEPPIQRVYERLWRFQKEVLLEVISVLNQRHVSPLVFKGAEFLCRCFDSRAVGMLFDVDILISRKMIEEAKIALHSIGLRQAVWDRDQGKLIDRDVADIARLELDHYELAPFSVSAEWSVDQEELVVIREWNQHPLYFVDGRVVAVVEVDIHHKVASDIESKPLFERAVKSAVPGALTLSPADLTWFTTSRFYTEVAAHGKRSIRDFAYLSGLLGSTPIDWDVLLRATREDGLASSLYYYFVFLNYITDGIIPSEVISALEPTRTPRLRDWGWQLGSLFEFIEDFPRSLTAGHIVA